MLTQLLRKLPGFAEDVPRTRVRCSQFSIALALGTLMCSSGLFRRLHACAHNMHIHRHTYTHTHIHKRGNKGYGEMAPQLRTIAVAEDPGLSGTHVVAPNVYNYSSKRFALTGHSGAHL